MREPEVISAARSDDVDRLRRLLDQDRAAANARGWMNETPLHAAALSGAVRAVRMLLEAGAQARARRDNADTPLHRAATAEIAELLFRAVMEVTPDSHNEFGQTPLHTVTDGEVAAVLVRHGASVTARTHSGSTPLHGAGEAKTRVLLEAGAEVDARDRWGRTPLHDAARSGEDSVVALLLAAGADPSVRDNGGSSPQLGQSGSVAEPADPAIVRISRQSSRRGDFGVAGHATLVRWRADQPEVIVPTEHTSIRDLAVHPHRPLVAVAPAKAPVELRDHDLAAPELLDDLMDGTALAFSPDGRWLAAAVDIERVVLFDLDTRRITGEAEAGEQTGCVDFSPDGSLLATTCAFQGGSHVRLDRVTGNGELEPVAEIEPHAGETISGAVFTPDGRHLTIRAGTDRRDVPLTTIDGAVQRRTTR